MGHDNVIPFDHPIQEVIEREIARALAKFGDDNVEVLAIVGSWGDTMDDREVLDALRKLNRTAKMFDDITDRSD